VSQDKAPGRYQGGKLFGVGVTFAKAQSLDLEKEPKRMMMVP
jgi:hypothetical protein